MPLNVPQRRRAAFVKFGMRASSHFSRSAHTVTMRFVSKRGSQKPPVTVTFVMSAARTG